MLTECPSCGMQVKVSIFYEQDRLPIHSCLMVDTLKEALEFPTGQLKLAFCPSCGFIWNTAFDATLMRYSAAYEETQAYSAHFRQFQTDLVTRWIERYDLHNKHVLEIGCGKGDFLVELCQRGANTGTGIDPSYRPDRHDLEKAKPIRFIRELYAPEHTHEPYDFITCRHTLEHIHEPLKFMQLCRQQATSDEKVIFAFELPAVERVLSEQAFWDIYYEHCSYFSLGSLARLFRANRLKILELYPDYDDQYLLIEAHQAETDNVAPHPTEESVAELSAEVTSFQHKIEQRLAWWDEFVRSRFTQGKRIAIWGSGSKAVAFLSRMNFTNEISCVVDINPHKHGKFLAAVGQEIVPPARLQEVCPDTVIAMNPVYSDEIASDLNKLGINAELVAL
ncbi:methyltransferase domain-containing protein [Calycomorphotria hydatis]|uniref:Ubiquinone biosynthesis O-methyltransferase n=1 Tax=Calycomorphotria hydatis TaxID=2528027 RepID=A0A517T670_9PLAN|nr:methyltransferase domain-containing protein [Calycomorphotria hydatis]QDT63864.1 Ubiquinone biosynthesis O-methyltransferase [Calycomorphotria hydatis]